jgi:hypothetical protein
MKNVFLLALLLAPFFATAQQPIQSGKAGKIEPFVQVGVTPHPFNASIMAVYWGDTKDMEGVKGDDGKPFKFNTLAEVFNYFDGQGYTFIADVTATAKIPQYNGIFLFKKKS